MRIFPQRSFRLLTYGLLAVVGAYWTGTTIYFLANCRPFEANWDMRYQNACNDPHAGWIGTGIANIVTDGMVLAVPMHKVWRLQLPSRTKIAVASVFGIGFL